MARYVCSDLHGQLILWRQIQATLKADDQLYCLGDCIDRGPDGITILTEMLDDPRVTVLMGNHEDMMLQVAPSLVKRFYENPKQNFAELTGGNLWTGYNGGYDTFDALLDIYPNAEAAQSFFDRVRELPNRKDLTNDLGEHIVLTHAGCDPWFSYADSSRLCSEGSKLNPYIWDRGHIADGDFPDDYQNYWVIHGHTPVMIYRYYQFYWYRKSAYEMNNPNSWKAITYCNGHKTSIDMGAFFSHMTCMINLDTKEELYFYDDNYYDRTEAGLLTLKQSLS